MLSAETSPQLARWVHRILLTGMLLSGGLLALGLASMFWYGPPANEPMPAVRIIFHRALTGDGLSLIHIGLMVLMATPVVRVGVLAIGWAETREWRFVAVAIVVLGLLALSISLGFG